MCFQIPERRWRPRVTKGACPEVQRHQMEAGQRSPDSSSEECTVLEAPPPKNTCLQHAAKVGVGHCWGGSLKGGQTWTWTRTCGSRLTGCFLPGPGSPPVLPHLCPCAV